MLFTALVLAAALAWAVALGRQSLPRALRAPLRGATARELGRDAARGWRELTRLSQGPWPRRRRGWLGPAAPEARSRRRAGG